MERHENLGDKSKEEQDLLERNNRKLNNEDQVLGGGPEEKLEIDDTYMIEVGSEREGKRQNALSTRFGPQVSIHKTQISYKSKLMGREEEALSKEFDLQIEEWLKEEEELSPELNEEQRKLIESLPQIPMSNDRLRALCEPWKDALIVTLLGRRAGLNMMRDRIGWLLKSNHFELIDLPNNYYVFRTESVEMRRRLLFDGPWLIQGHYLAVQRWSPNFNPYCNKVQKVAVWIRVPTLPMHVYSEECLMELGNLIGTALKVDVNTLAQGNNRNLQVERGRYARVSVEVDLNKQLKSRFVIRKKIFSVEYEGLDEICFKCGKYGHKEEKCPMADMHGKTQGDENPGSKMVGKGHNGNLEQKEKHSLFSIPGMKEEEEFGDWMKAKNVFRPRGRRPDSGRVTAGEKAKEKDKRQGGGSRFEILQDKEDHVRVQVSGKENKANAGNKEWRRKGLKSQKEGDQESSADLVKEKEEFQEMVGCGSSHKEAIDVTFSAQSIQGTIKPLVGFEREKSKVLKRNKKNEGEVGRKLGPNDGIKKKTEGGKKRAIKSRPKQLSTDLKKKSVFRAHRVVFGEFSDDGPITLKATEAQREDHKAENHDIRDENLNMVQGNEIVGNNEKGGSLEVQQFISSDSQISEFQLDSSQEMVEAGDQNQVQNSGETDGMEVVPSSL